ncbi:hypothetical protein YTPLAS18_16280 [Nitrospira sp.]|nr:hypothetical protein YTPLAS18_16280 [Nitrospira sp.]
MAFDLRSAVTLEFLAACLLGLVAIIVDSTPAFSTEILQIADLVTHPEQYDHQQVRVTGQVTNMQLATTRDGRPAYGFLLKDQAGTLKVVALGRAEIREGDLIIVEGLFSRMRQAGRTIIYNEIKASSVRSMTRLNPDLVG